MDKDKTRRKKEEKKREKRGKKLEKVWQRKAPDAKSLLTSLSVMWKTEKPKSNSK